MTKTGQHSSRSKPATHKETSQKDDALFSAIDSTLEEVRQQNDKIDNLSSRMQGNLVEPQTSAPETLSAPPLTHAYVPLEVTSPPLQETEQSSIKAQNSDSASNYVPVQPVSQNQMHTTSSETTYPYKLPDSQQSILSSDQHPAKSDIAQDFSQPVPPTASTGKTNKQAHSRTQTKGGLRALFSIFKKKNKPTSPNPQSPPVSQKKTGKKRKTWRQSIKERRRRRIWFEELLGWIFVPIILFFVYWCLIGIFGLFGKTPEELWDGIVTALEEVKRRK